ncbi:MAG: lytic transglycosylase domain-containing protein [Candidatus Margulisbacteria bacterium]|nr:lytic transglycosylase domain-containing protein [Candidatus Margulisiibacteriota bacterium]
MKYIILGLIFFWVVPNFGDDTSTILSFIQARYPSVGSANAREISQTIVTECDAVDMDPFLIAAIIAVESKFDANARGRGGAAGLGQMMPGTYRLMGVSDPYDIHENIVGTVKYLNELFRYWKHSKMARRLSVASYNKGEIYFKRRGGKLNASGRRYVAKIQRQYDRIEVLDMQ